MTYRELPLGFDWWPVAEMNEPVYLHVTLLQRAEGVPVEWFSVVWTKERCNVCCPRWGALAYSAGLVMKLSLPL